MWLNWFQFNVDCFFFFLRTRASPVVTGRLFDEMNLKHFAKMVHTFVCFGRCFMLYQRHLGSQSFYYTPNKSLSKLKVEWVSKTKNSVGQKKKQKRKCDQIKWEKAFKQRLEKMNKWRNSWPAANNFWHLYEIISIFFCPSIKMFHIRVRMSIHNKGKNTYTYTYPATIKYF